MNDRGYEGLITDGEPCPYLEDREWRNFVVNPGEPLEAAVHQQFLNQGFRRTGGFVYRPHCPDCRACRSLRIDVDRFRPSRSQRRALNRNGDLETIVASPAYSEEKRSLLERYLDARHRGPMTADEEQMRAGLFDNSADSLEIDYRLDGRLVGVGIVDLTPEVLSSLYFFFAPEESKRSLGIFSMLREIELVSRTGRRFYHPGYYIAGCAAMEYKSRLRPCEILQADGRWVPFEES